MNDEYCVSLIVDCTKAKDWLICDDEEWADMCKDELFRFSLCPWKCGMCDKCKYELLII